MWRLASASLITGLTLCSPASGSGEIYQIVSDLSIEIREKNLNQKCCLHPFRVAVVEWKYTPFFPLTTTSSLCLLFVFSSLGFESGRRLISQNPWKSEKWRAHPPVCVSVREGCGGCICLSTSPFPDGAQQKESTSWHALFVSLLIIARLWDLPGIWVSFQGQKLHTNTHAHTTWCRKCDLLAGETQERMRCRWKRACLYVLHNPMEVGAELLSTWICKCVAERENQLLWVQMATCDSSSPVKSF